jgi:hypothetical protein
VQRTRGSELRRNRISILLILSRLNKTKCSASVQLVRILLFYSKNCFDKKDLFEQRLVTIKL